jgi:hypothetical protein
MLNWREVGGEHLQRPLDDPSFVFRVSASSHTVATVKSGITRTGTSQMDESGSGSSELGSLLGLKAELPSSATSLKIKASNKLLRLCTAGWAQKTPCIWKMRQG